MTQTARRDSWKTKAPTSPFRELDYSDSFTAEEFAKIRDGLVPKEMEDKWFIYFEEQTLYLHRSWTGHLIYRVQFRVTPDGASVSGAAVVEDTEVYNPATDDEPNKLQLPWLVRGLLLDQYLPFPDL